MMLDTYREDLTGVPPAAEFLVSPQGALASRDHQHWVVTDVPKGWFRYQVGDYLTDAAVVGWSVWDPSQYTGD